MDAPHPGGIVPSSPEQSADLSSPLYALLLQQLAFLLLAALAAATLAWWLWRRRRSRLDDGQAGAPLWRDEPVVAEPAGRRFLRIAFGVLWLVDALLQVQPSLPGSFAADVLAPGLAASPPWLADAVGPLVRIWTRHPVMTDAATFWIQLGLGVLILIGGRGRLSRLALWSSVAWSVVVWACGEFLGGLLDPGATWLTGAPGAVLVYACAAGLLLMPWRWWDGARAARVTSAVVGGWLLLAAALQAAPAEGSWTREGLTDIFRRGAAVAQPAVLRRPVVAAGSLAAAHPVAVNAAVVSVLLIVGAGLCAGPRRVFLWVGVAVCGATWWLAQDFGVLGGTATDPNTALPLALLLVAALPHWRQSTPVATAGRDASRLPWHPLLRPPASAGLTALGLGALVVPLVTATVLLGPADRAAVTVDSGGGVHHVPHRPAPDFLLPDQDGHLVSLAALRGRVTLVTFLDPVCSDDCPVIANQLAVAAHRLGPLAAHVEIVAVDSNPVFTGRADVAAFTGSHGLDTLPNWHFLSGDAAALSHVMAAYGVVVQVPAVGMVEHGEGIYFVGPDGTLAAYLADGADADLTGTYAATVADEVRRLLP